MCHRCSNTVCRGIVPVANANLLVNVKINSDKKFDKQKMIFCVALGTIFYDLKGVISVFIDGLRGVLILYIYFTRIRAQ